MPTAMRSGAAARRTDVGALTPWVPRNPAGVRRETCAGRDSGNDRVAVGTRSPAATFISTRTLHQSLVIDHPPTGRTPRIGGSHASSDRRQTDAGPPAREIPEGVPQGRR